MPRNLNAWLDICFILFAALILTGILTYYNLVFKIQFKLNVNLLMMDL